MEYSKETTEIIFTPSAEESLASLLQGFQADQVLLATEQTVERLWLHAHPYFGRFPMVVLPAGEEQKKLSSVAQVWEFLSRSGASRRSILINVGGGMLTDLVGFAASTFKRGIGFINIPTTLLSQVDASVGGKTGFNFLGLKNEIGTFTEPLAVIIDTHFLSTLDRGNFLSGFAEMIKHGLIADPGHLQELMDYQPDATISQRWQLPAPDGEEERERLSSIIRRSVAIKKHFVDQDPREKGIRKALNFGHTTGHAIESLALEAGEPLLHGYAVAWGMIAELHLSVSHCGFPRDEAVRMTRWIRHLYGEFPSLPGRFKDLHDLMSHDKKNEAGRINFTLLSSPGKILIDQYCSEEEILAALKILYNQ